MSTPLSLDLQHGRDSLFDLTAVASGLSHRQAGERFGVSAASVSRWRALERLPCRVELTMARTRCSRIRGTPLASASRRHTPARQGRCTEALATIGR